MTTDTDTTNRFRVRVLATTNHTNAFGYRGVLMIDEDGVVYEGHWNIGRGEKRPQPTELVRLVRDRTGVSISFGEPWSMEMITKRDIQPDSDELVAELLEIAGWTGDA